MDINITVSQNIKKVREQKKLTLDMAAAATGVSRSMLAQIEKGDVNPTVTVLWKIANGYKVSFSSLTERPPEETSLIRGDTVSPVLEDEGRYKNFPVFRFDDRRLFETYRIVIDPKGKLCARPHMGGAEEYITVFAGEVEITVENKSFSLGAGDSISFKADVPHSYKNTADTEAQLSMVIYYGE